MAERKYIEIAYLQNDAKLKSLGLAEGKKGIAIRNGITKWASTAYPALPVKCAFGLSAQFQTECLFTV